MATIFVLTPEKAEKAFQTLESVADSLPYEAREEFELLKEVY